MEMKRQSAAVFLLIGMLLILTSVVNFVQGSKGWVSDQKRYYFMAAVLIAGVLFACNGWTRLSTLKKGKAEQTWWQFLKVEIIGVAILVSFGVSYLIMPEETRKTLGKTVHNFMEAIHAIKPSHP
jgi:hypothetical protein